MSPILMLMLFQLLLPIDCHHSFCTIKCLSQSRDIGIPGISILILIESLSICCDFEVVLLRSLLWVKAVLLTVYRTHCSDSLVEEPRIVSGSSLT